MKRATMVLISTGAVCVAVATALYVTHDPVEQKQANTADVTSRHDDTRLAQPRGALGRAPQVGILVAREKARDNPYWAEVYSPNLVEAFRRVAAVDDPAAAATAFEISVRCSLYTDLLYPRTLEKIERGGAKPEVMTRQREVAEAQRKRCLGFTSDDIALGVSRQAYLKERNDPRSAANNLPFTMPDEAFAKAKAAAELKDPYAIREVGTYFLSRMDLGRNPTYDLGDGLQVTPRMMYDAFTLAACSYGEDCSPANTLVASRCVNAGQCDASSVEDLLLRYSYSPADAERLLALRQIVLTGLDSGRWPTNFWTAPRQIPAHLLKR